MGGENRWANMDTFPDASRELCCFLWLLFQSLSSFAFPGALKIDESGVVAWHDLPKPLPPCASSLRAVATTHRFFGYNINHSSCLW